MQIKVGVIGLGNMGMPMATNLAAAGHDVTGFDVSDLRLDSVKIIAFLGP